MSDYAGTLVNLGGAVERVVVGSVNSTLVFSDIPESCLTIYGQSIEWSNSSTFSSLVVPTDGLVIWEFTTDNVRWQQMYSGNYRPQDNYIIPPKAVGNIVGIRVTTSNIVGALFARIKFQSFTFLDNGIDPRVYNGPYAVTTQSFIESNGKRGLSYEASFSTPIAGNGDFDFVFETGVFITLVKSRQLQFEGSGITSRVFRNPTFTGGTVVPYYNLNDNIAMQVPTDVVIRAGITVTNTGTEMSAPTYSIGSSSGGGNAVGTFALPGAERVLAPATKYLLRVHNDDSTARKVAGYISWFSGRISTQN